MLTFAKSAEIFRHLSDEALQHLSDLVETIEIHGGDVLIHEGEQDDCLYVVMSGLLQVLAPESSPNADQVIAEVGEGQSIGEMALLTGEPRSATVRAARDSKLLKLSSKHFDELIAHDGRSLLSITRQIIERLRKTTLGVFETPQIRTIAVIAGSISTPFFMEFTQTLRRSLDNFKDVTILVASSDQLDLVESITRQADRILVVADAKLDPALTVQEQKLLEKPERRSRTSLVLIHAKDTVLPSNTHNWLSLRPIKNHYHVREGVQGDHDRLGRLLFNRANSLVLSGGGARGSAHYGIIQALIEKEIPIDAIGGTSAGSIAAAQIAMFMSPKQALKTLVTLIKSERVFDSFTLPFFSLFKGERLEMAMRKAFKDVVIEDLWLPYFCVASNLTLASKQVFQSGPIWQATRASASIPGVFPPFSIGKHFFADGGLMDNLPVATMQNLYPGFLMAVDVGPQREIAVQTGQFPKPWQAFKDFIFKKTKSNGPNIGSILVRATMINSVERGNAAKKIADLVFTPSLEEFSLLNYDSAEQIAEVSYQYAMETLATHSLVPKLLK